MSEETVDTSRSVEDELGKVIPHEPQIEVPQMVVVPLTVKEADDLWSVLDSERESVQDTISHGEAEADDYTALGTIIRIMNRIHTAIEETSRK